MSALSEAAAEYGAAGWTIFPLAERSKVPKIAKADGGNGVLDATDDPSTIGGWWQRWPSANIGGRVPAGLIVIDTDPRHGGETNLVIAGPLVPTLTSFSGRGDGGRHRYYLHPGGKLESKRLPEGVDLKTHAGYVVLPPSIHPDSGLPYQWEEPLLPPVRLPDWLETLLRPVQAAPSARAWTGAYHGESIAEWFCATHSWAEILAGWTLVAGDGETDGSGWRHPAATSKLSATIKHGCLFVYSTNTALEPTGAGDPHGYTKFRAWATLEHHGDLHAAAHAARLHRLVTP
jgi:hypothetical protein